MTGDAAGYSPTDTPENDAVDTLEYILDSKAKSNIDTRDKYPNHDGNIELVDDDGKPVGRFTVQVKKLPERNDTPKRQFEIKTLNYSKCIAEPFILVIVDTGDDVAYWRHIPPRFVEEEGIEDQKTRVIHFPEENSIRESDSDYLDEWGRITETTRKRVEDYDEYQELKELVDPALGERRPEFKEIHAFLDSYNNLIDSKFPILKETLYTNLWKFGYVNLRYENDRLSYALYPIELDENIPQIREVEEGGAGYDDTWDILEEFNAIRGVSHPHNPIHDNKSEKYAYNAIESNVERLFELRALRYDSCTFLATEYIYHFLEEFHHLLGLEQKERYSISEVYERYYNHFQIWLEDVAQSVIDTEDENVEFIATLDNYSSVDTEEFRESVNALAEKTDYNPSVYPIRSRDFEQYLIEEFLYVLYESDEEYIQRPYHPRDRRLGDRGHRVIDYYSDEALIQNVETYYTNIVPEYERLLELNFSEILPELVQENNIKWGIRNLTVVIVNTERLNQDTRRLSAKVVVLETEEDETRVKVHRDTDEEVQKLLDIEDPLDSDVVYDGEEYSTVRWSDTSCLHVITENRPVFKRLHSDREYDSLYQTVMDYIEERKVSIL
jgi:hypothetical protein